MEILETIGARIKALRKERNLRQEDLANELGITPRHYQKMEYGKVNLPTLTLCARADFYGVSLDYLVGRTDQRCADAGRLAAENKQDAHSPTYRKDV